MALHDLLFYGCRRRHSEIRQQQRVLEDGRALEQTFRVHAPRRSRREPRRLFAEGPRVALGALAAGNGNRCFTGEEGFFFFRFLGTVFSLSKVVKGSSSL